MSSRMRTLQRKQEAEQADTDAKIAAYRDRLQAIVDKAVTEQVGHIVAENERLKACLAKFDEKDTKLLKDIITSEEWTGVEELLGKIEDAMRARDA